MKWLTVASRRSGNGSSCVCFFIKGLFPAKELDPAGDAVPQGNSYVLTYWTHVLDIQFMNAWWNKYSIITDSMCNLIMIFFFSKLRFTQVFEVVFQCASSLCVCQSRHTRHSLCFFWFVWWKTSCSLWNMNSTTTILLWKINSGWKSVFHYHGYIAFCGTGCMFIFIEFMISSIFIEHLNAAGLHIYYKETN